jgi:hypothetical protein
MIVSTTKRAIHSRIRANPVMLKRSSRPGNMRVPAKGAITNLLKVIRFLIKMLTVRKLRVNHQFDIGVGRDL